MSSLQALGLGVLTAPAGDWISPSSASPGHDTIIWRDEAAKGGYLDIFDSKEESDKRKELGEFDRLKK